jgi:hypothetical protein
MYKLCTRCPSILFRQRKYRREITCNFDTMMSQAIIWKYHISLTLNCLLLFVTLKTTQGLLCVLKKFSQNPHYLSVKCNSSWSRLCQLAWGISQPGLGLFWLKWQRLPVNVCNLANLDRLIPPFNNFDRLLGPLSCTRKPPQLLDYPEIRVILHSLCLWYMTVKMS